MEDAWGEAAASVLDVRHGVAEGRVVGRGGEHATVEVRLLEGPVLRLRVETRGWRREKEQQEEQKEEAQEEEKPDKNNQDKEEEEDEWFETLHSLLVAVSPLYKKSFADSVAAKLKQFV